MRVMLLPASVLIATTLWFVGVIPACAEGDRDRGGGTVVVITGPDGVVQGEVIVAEPGKPAPQEGGQPGGDAGGPAAPVGLEAPGVVPVVSGVSVSFGVPVVASDRVVYVPEGSQPLREDHVCVQTRSGIVCAQSPEVPATPAPATGGDEAVPVGPSFGEVQGWAQSATATMQVPVPQVRIGPDPSVNEWNMVAVGFPIWLWTDDPGQLSASAAVGGVSLTMQAVPVGTEFDLGDGSSIWCVGAPAYPVGVKPGTPSPSCGHRYTAKPAGGQVTITATTVWQVMWSGAGYSGVIPMQRSSSRTVEVGELVSVVIR